MPELNQYLPQPSTWFSQSITYAGIGRIIFSNPHGWVEGEAVCEVNSIGELTIELGIESWKNNSATEDSVSSDDRDWLISGIRAKKEGVHRIYLLPVPSKNTIQSMSITTSNGGELKITNIIYYDWYPSEGKIKVITDQAIYIAPEQTKSNAKYWVLPCINLNLGKVFGATIAYQFDDLQEHPLRIYPVPEATYDFFKSDASEQDKSWVRHHLTAMSYIVHFSYNTKTAFIESLPNYQSRIQDLQAGKAKFHITSIMVGEYHSEIDEMKPLDLLPIISVASGRTVGASWIEFRDDQANLVYRIHANLGRYSYQRGRPIVHDLVHKGGLGILLSEASKSNLLAEPLIRGALHNCAKAISSPDVTTMFYYTFTAFDGLFTYYKIAEQIHPIQSHLSSSQIKDIRKILKYANSSIKTLAKQKGVTQKQADIINSVANKIVSQPLDKRSQFGDKVVALMGYFKLLDVDLLSAHYSHSLTWSNKVNMYRNATMHATHYQNVFDADTRQEIHALMPHLIDILIRILLSAVDYSGNYAPYMKSPNSSEKIDWVQMTTTAKALGYR